MRERYVRPPLVADEPRERRAAASRPAAVVLTIVALAVAVAVALLLADRLRGESEQPRIDRTPSASAPASTVTR